MLRRLLIVAAVLVGLLALADQGLKLVAENTVANAVQESEGLDENPSVSFSGFPFLTQAIGGRFEGITVTIRGYAPHGKESLRLDRIVVRLRGVKVGFGHVLSGNVDVVPVDSGAASLRVRFADLDEFLSRRPGELKVTGAAGELAVRGRIGLPRGGSLDIVGRGRPKVQGRSVSLTITSVRLADGTEVPRALVAAARKRLSFVVALDELPLCLSLDGIDVSDQGVEVHGKAARFVIHTTGVKRGTCA